MTSSALPFYPVITQQNKTICLFFIYAYVISRYMTFSKHFWIDFSETSPEDFFATSNSTSPLNPDPNKNQEDISIEYTLYLIKAYFHCNLLNLHSPFTSDSLLFMLRQIFLKKCYRSNLDPDTLDLEPETFFPVLSCPNSRGK